MPKNKLEDLRNHLFEAIELLKDGDLDVEKAKAIKGLGDTIVNSAKAEIHAANAVKNNSRFNSEFFNHEKTIDITPQTKLLAGDEVENCKCGSEVYPADLEKCEQLGLDYPRCAECLDLLPKNLDVAKANSFAN